MTSSNNRNINFPRPLIIDEVTVGFEQSEAENRAAILAFPAAAAAGDEAGTTLYVREYQLCAVYTTHGQHSREWGKKDTAKIVVEDVGDMATGEA